MLKLLLSTVSGDDNGIIDIAKALERNSTTSQENTCLLLLYSNTVIGEINASKLALLTENWHIRIIKKTFLRICVYYYMCVYNVSALFKQTLIFQCLNFGLFGLF